MTRPMGTPDESGRFGEFGGRFVPEALIPACLELEAAFTQAWADPAFRREYERLLREYANRPSPTYEAKNLSERLGVRVLLKREELNHTGSHKINNVLGQALLTQHMGKKRFIAAAQEAGERLRLDEPDGPAPFDWMDDE